LARTQVSLHVTGERPIRDDHLAAYCQALDKPEKSALIAAWLRDLLDARSQEEVLEPTSNRIGEESRAWRPQLDADLGPMLDWWSKELACDRELADIFRGISRKAGFDVSKQNIATFPAQTGTHAIPPRTSAASSGKARPT
jgi:hypothetical protein